MGTGKHIANFVRRSFAALLACALAFGAASARDRHARMLTDPDLDAALVIDAKSGGVLYARNAEAQRHPASLTKMMTLYLLFENLRAHKISLASEIDVSANAAAQPRSHLGLRRGSAISVDLAIKAIVVGSANDAAVAVAEALGGTESHFAELMTAKARQLGMAHSYFHNATGLPDDLQQTTAQDLSILARHLLFDYPEYFGYFRLTQLSWHGDLLTTHDSLIGTYQGADGIKTGYIDASGYNLVSTATRGGRRLIAVVMGGLTAEKRDAAMTALLDATFAIAPAAPPPAVRATRISRAAGRAPATPKPESASLATTILMTIAIDPGSSLVWSAAFLAAHV